MKYSKRILTLVLALTMICAMAISVSAATYGSYYYSTNYNGASVEVCESCKTFEFSSSLISDSSYYLESIAEVYGWKSVKVNGVETIQDGSTTDYATFISNGTMVASLSESHTLCYINHVKFVHKIDGTTISTHELYPSYT